MKSYSLMSIDKKLCSLSDPRLLKALGTCIKCNKIPLPSYRSTQDFKNTYCQKCYEEQNFDPNNLIENTKMHKINFGGSKMINIDGVIKKIKNKKDRIKYKDNENIQPYLKGGCNDKNLRYRIPFKLIRSILN